MEKFIQFDYSILDAIINERVEVAVEKALKNYIPINVVPETDDLISRKEARKVLGNISNPTIIEWGKKGIIACHRIGSSSIRYRRSELLASIKQIQTEKLKQ